jgi:RNA polymerase sigma-70 factor (ECF subfamily)
MAHDDTLSLQLCLERLQAGDEAAREDLLRRACERLRRLTRAMLKEYARLKRWEETDDVFQSASLRLYRALQQMTPESPRHFFHLATVQIRRELIDLARHYYGPAGPGTAHESDAGGENSPTEPRRTDAQPDAAPGPGELAAWSEFHEQVEALPAEEQEVFDLLWYQGLTPAEAAPLLNVSDRTVRRRWLAACRALHRVLDGELPG